MHLSIKSESVSGKRSRRFDRSEIGWNMAVIFSGTFNCLTLQGKLTQELQFVGLIAEVMSTVCYPVSFSGLSQGEVPSVF